jgi:hypothetical protein
MVYGGQPIAAKDAVSGLRNGLEAAIIGPLPDRLLNPMYAL